jgi:hypothetical protein
MRGKYWVIFLRIRNQSEFLSNEVNGNLVFITNVYFKNSFHQTNYVPKSWDGYILNRTQYFREVDLFPFSGEKVESTYPVHYLPLTTKETCE